jgi:hypothetical protein
LDSTLGAPQSEFGRFKKEKKLLLFPGIQPRFFEHASSGLVTVLTELSRLLSPSVTKVTISSDVVVYGWEIFGFNL